MQTTSRRTYLKVGGSATLAAMTALAGCSDGKDADEDKARVPNEPDYRGWFEGVSNYDGTIDQRDRDEVTVTVGAQGNNGYYTFGPAAVAVSAETTVTWEWSGRGGAHNVVAEQGSFDSGNPVDEDGNTFTDTFDSPAVYKYVCEPHRSLGMRGAVFVALGQSE